MASYNGEEKSLACSLVTKRDEKFDRCTERAGGERKMTREEERAEREEQEEEEEVRKTSDERE